MNEQYNVLYNCSDAQKLVALQSSMKKYTDRIAELEALAAQQEQLIADNQLKFRKQLLESMDAQKQQINTEKDVHYNHIVRQHLENTQKIETNYNLELAQKIDKIKELEMLNNELVLLNKENQMKMKALEESNGSVKQRYDGAIAKAKKRYQTLSDELNSACE